MKALFEWLLRKRSPALATMRIGLACLTVALAAGLAFDISIPVKNGHIELRYDGGDGAPATLIYLVAGFALTLIVAGLIWEFWRNLEERGDALRKKVIVIEARGLRDTSGTPLVAAVPTALAGRREQLLVDLRQRIKDGAIVDPAAAVKDVMDLPGDIRRRENGLDRSDITYVYGGLTPVPLTFLMGSLVDDEGRFFVMDWDRHTESWRGLDAADDGGRFAITWQEAIKNGTPDVALVVSVSYGINTDDLRGRADGIPTVLMTLPNGTPDAHWSEAKQVALGRQFLETLIALKGLGVSRVHLFLAAQNSVVFRLGRLYDKRNLPEVIVYQYERGKTPAYPWGLRMPVAGVELPEIIRISGER